MTIKDTGAKSDQGQRGTGEGKDNQQIGKDPHWTTKVEAFCAIALVAITGFYTYYSAGQLHKMKRSTEAAERANALAESANKISTSTMLASNRNWIQPRLAEPWFSAHPEQAIKILAKMEAAWIPIELTNTGKSPVKNIQGLMKGELLPRNEQSRLDLSKNSFTSHQHLMYVSSPSQADIRVFGADNRPVEITENLIKDLVDGNTYIVLYGKWYFSDDFGQHWIQWCHPIPFKLNWVYSYRNCIDYNDAGDVPVGKEVTLFPQ